MKTSSLLKTAPFLLAIQFLCCDALLADEDRVQAILKQTGFNGGVAVHVASSGGDLLPGLLEQRPGALGHVLVRGEQAAREIRKRLHESGQHGAITVGAWDGGPLPFIENFVNLIVVDGGTRIPRKEILRALAPNGVAVVGTKKIAKPRPGAMDDWPQYLYDAGGNQVSKDKALVPPLAHMQWVGSPRWSRHHDTMSSVSACVSGDDKVFYIFDEGNTFTPYFPSRWKLIARDAFNGVILWKHPIDEWVGNLHRLKSGPATLPRRVVVAGKKLYATLGIKAPVSVMETGSGRIQRTLEGSEGAEEIVHDGEFIYLVADVAEKKEEYQGLPRMTYRRGNEWINREKKILCYSARTDAFAWSKTFDYVAPLTLVADRSKLYFFDGKTVVAINSADGERIWHSEELPVLENMPTYFAPKLLVRSGVVMFSGGEDYKPHNGSIGQLSGLSTENGKLLWTSKHPASGYQSPENLFVVDGKAWAPNVTAMSSAKADASKRTGDLTTFDLGSGNAAVKFGDVPAYWFHHRCYPAKATEDYMILSRTGTEFVDFKTGEWTLHHWVRGACLSGILPANGLLYAPQHPCACYIGAKMFGFTALAPANDAHPSLTPTPDADRLQSAPPKTRSAFPRKDAPLAGEWPIYRGDAGRNGFIGGLAAPKAQRWSIQLSGALTPPVIADDKVVVANKDNFSVTAFDAKSGGQIWRHLPAGRVDSSPTLYRGLVYFGASDGTITCLDLADGVLRWKYQAAPSRARHMYFERVESTHPVHGSVLVMNDKLYTVAGRSVFTDGGMRFFVLDALTGDKLHEQVLDENLPGGESLQMSHEVFNMPMALPDILSSNGEKIFMRYQPFDFEGNRIETPYDGKMYGYTPEDYEREIQNTYDQAADQGGPNAHIFSGTGFLDDSWWHRTYWIYGKNHTSGFGGYSKAGASGAPAGRMITADADRIYTWGRMQNYFRWSEEYVYHLHAKNRAYESQWNIMVPILVRAMVASDDALFLLGPEELMRQHLVKRSITEADTLELMARQERVMDGQEGCTLLVVDKSDGTIRAGARLDGVPEHDGMAGAYGNLYLSMADGRLLCLGAGGSPLDALSSTEIGELNANSAPPEVKPLKKPGPRKPPLKKDAAKGGAKAGK